MAKLDPKQAFNKAKARYSDKPVMIRLLAVFLQWLMPLSPTDNDGHVRAERRERNWYPDL